MKTYERDIRQPRATETGPLTTPCQPVRTYNHLWRNRGKVTVVEPTLLFRIAFWLRGCPQFRTS